MKLQALDQGIKSLDGQEIMIEGEIFSFKKAFVNALTWVHEDEKTLSGEEKIKRYELAKKIFASSDLELSVDEASMLLKLVNKAYGTLIYGACHEYVNS